MSFDDIGLDTAIKSEHKTQRSPYKSNPKPLIQDYQKEIEKSRERMKEQQEKFKVNLDSSNQRIDNEIIEFQQLMEMNKVQQHKLI